VIALEPMLTSAPVRVVEDADGWTLRTHNRMLAVHHEHTIVIRRGTPARVDRGRVTPNVTDLALAQRLERAEATANAAVRGSSRETDPGNRRRVARRVGDLRDVRRRRVAADPVVRARAVRSR
jgi:hypothetical protein